MNIKTNERELAGRVAEWFNEQIKRASYPFSSASCESGIKVGKTTYFGDIILWKNRESNEAFAYLELKPPFGKTEDLERMRLKALELRAKIAYTWDFQNLVAYQIEENQLTLKDSEAHSILTNIEDWKRGDVQANIKAYISKICDELLTFSERGKFQKFKPEKHFFIRFIREVVENLTPHFEQHIRLFHKQKKSKDIINKFVAEQGIPFSSDEGFYLLIARQRVYGLVTKIIFYLMIKRHFTELPNLFSENEEDISENLKYAFSRAREIDWQAVFETDAIEELGIPQASNSILNELFSHLNIYNFGDLPEDVVGELFEEIIDPKRRHELGQYFTREDLVDLVIATIVHDPNGIYADPTCGSGTFLIRLYDRLVYLNNHRKKHEEILNQIWGLDIGKFPAELSTINLFRQEASNFENFPRVRKDDIFDIYTGREIDFPPNNVNYKGNYNKIMIKIPAFHGFVGNFPFIRQELIEKSVKGYKQKISEIITYEYFKQYPNLFKTKGITDAMMESFQQKTEPEQKELLAHWLEGKNVELRLSGQADIYSYIFLHTAALLKSDGSFAIITSNSWLDVSYGSVLKEFFLAHFKVKMLVASWAEPWFDDAAVNTVFTVLEKCNKQEERDNNLVHFVKLKQKLEELIPERNLKFESQNRWRRIDGIVNTIEMAKYSANKINETISSFENEQMRVRMVKQGALKQEIESQKELSKWGKYLRAPDVYFEILERCHDKLVPLKTVADVRFGIKTGVNEFFYLQPISENKEQQTILCKNSRGWQGEIESCYLKPVIKSPKESDSIVIDPKKLKNLLFICNKSKAELKKANHLLTLRYIEWGEKQRTKENKLWSEVPSVHGRKYWWFLPDNKPGKILFQMINNERFIVYNNKDEVKVDHNLFEYLINDEHYSDFAYKYLNSTFFALIKEVNSRINLGDGATKTEGVDWNNLMLIPQKILTVNINIDKISKRKIEPISKEVKKKDRQQLDKAVLEAMGLEPEIYLPKIYAGLTEMVKERLELPKMRQKRKQQKVEVSYEEVKKSVIEEIIGTKIKKFPQDFFTNANTGFDYDSVETEVYNTSGKQLHFEEFFQICTVKDEDGNEIFQTEQQEIAKFAVILAKPDVYRLKVPKDVKIVRQILENYRSYLLQMKELLTANAQQKLHSWNETEQMTKEILEEFGLKG